MIKKELFLKTLFCCIACDMDIAVEEVDLLRQLYTTDENFSELDAENLINRWIGEVNDTGYRFLRSYLNDLSLSEITPKEQLQLVNYAIKAIEADNRIEYAEVKFFKKIRSRLSVSDEEILQQHPDKEDFLLPDINISEDLEWDETIPFKPISLTDAEKKHS